MKPAEYEKMARKLDVIADPFPSMKDRPKYVCLDDWVKYDGKEHRPGVYYCGTTTGKKDESIKPVDTWFCSPLHIDAITFDSKNRNHGRLLRFKPAVGKWTQWAMPMVLLAGDCVGLRAELFTMGVELDHHKSRQYLPPYQGRNPLEMLFYV